MQSVLKAFPLTCVLSLPVFSKKPVLLNGGNPLSHMDETPNGIAFRVLIDSVCKKLKTSQSGWVFTGKGKGDGIDEG